MVASPGRTRAFETPSWRKSRCRPAVIRVVSAFQNKMSNGGGLRPSTPRPHLQVVHDPAAFGETGKPVTQSLGSGSTKQGQHHAFGSERQLVPRHIGARQRHRPLGRVAVGNRIRWAVGPVELREGVQLNSAAKDFTVERQGLTSSAGEKDVGRRVGHGSDAIHRCQPVTGGGGPAVADVRAPFSERLNRRADGIKPGVHLLPTVQREPRLAVHVSWHA